VIRVYYSFAKDADLEALSLLLLFSITDYWLQTDACNDDIGGILLQEENGIKHPIAFASKKLLPRERNYSTIEKECLANRVEIMSESVWLYTVK